MTTSNSAFESAAHRWLSFLQQDLKDFVRVVVDDLDLEDGLRELAAGAVLYALSPSDVIPDSIGPLGYVDDALALRVVLDEIRRRAPARFESYGSRLSDMIAKLAEDLAASSAFFEDLYEPLCGRMMETDRFEFKGKRVADVLADPEWLDAEIALVVLKLDFKPGEIDSAVKKVATLLPRVKQKLSLRK